MDLLNSDAVSFLRELELKFGHRRKDLLRTRIIRQHRIDSSIDPLNFLPETANIRASDWKVAPIPPDLQDRRVEITGPTDRKMIINALNSGANVFMADFEDSNVPTWDNLLTGQANLYDAVRKTITFTSLEGKEYKLNEKTAVLFVRPRGWHMEETHFQVNDQPMSASLFDFGLFFFHNAKELVSRGTGPYFYLPKMESYLEARLWNDVFVFAQEYMGLPQGAVRATALIETLPAAFEMDEILWELKDHSAGLNCGRWDYIFSFIKKMHKLPNMVFPDRSLVTMEVPFLRNYSKLLINTCHRRGIHAMGGMAAQIPIKNDFNANDIALARVAADKYREVIDGHDGTWVAHPGLIKLARDIFDNSMPTNNQLDKFVADVNLFKLLEVPEGAITEQGIQTNIRVALIYLESWLRGNGCVPINNLMEDAATAEISRVQLWQWIQAGKLTIEEYESIVAEEASKLLNTSGTSKTREAWSLLNHLVLSKDLPDFLTTIAPEYMVDSCLIGE